MQDNQELNFLVAGKPFAGAGTVAKIIYGNWTGFKYIDMNYLVNNLYYDFQMINRHTGQMRRVIKSSVILKNAEFLYRSIGIPEFISAQKMWDWCKYIDEPCSPIAFKRAIWRTMREINPTWRNTFVRERVIERPSLKYVYCHAVNVEEVSCIKNPIIIWVESSDINRYRFGSVSSQGAQFSDIYTKEFEKFEEYCQKKASFIIYNNNQIIHLEQQLDELAKSLGVETNGKRINFYVDKKKKRK